MTDHRSPFFYGRDGPDWWEPDCIGGEEGSGGGEECSGGEGMVSSGGVENPAIGVSIGGGGGGGGQGGGGGEDDDSDEEVVLPTDTEFLVAEAMSRLPPGADSDAGAEGDLESDAGAEGYLSGIERESIVDLKVQKNADGNAGTKGSSNGVPDSSTHPGFGGGCPPKNKVLKWNELPSSLQFVLPLGDDYSYVVESYDEVVGATSDSPHFNCTMRINLVTEEEAKVWIEKMSERSRCTYRTTKTVKPGQKRVKCKFVKHCQHFAKKLSPKQLENVSLLRAKKAKTPLASQLRNKKTQCPSSFTLSVQITSKLHQRKAVSKPHLLSHCGVFKVNFNHNHPITAAHTLSFRDVSTETRKELTAWVTAPPPQDMLMNRDYYVKQNWISKSPKLIDRKIQTLNMFVASIANGD